jgi:hypothetical protein
MLYTSKEIIFHKSHLLLYTRVPKSAQGTPVGVFFLISQLAFARKLKAKD